MAATSSTSSATSTASMASSPNTTCNFNDQACGVPSSGTLYLFTFLATLIMLSAVAGAIVVRSMIIRRRQRERINQAVANGTYMSPSHRGRVDINAKPSMYEVCLDFKDTETDEKSWNGTQPCSAAYTIIPSPSVCDLPKSPHRDSSAPSVSPRRRHFLNPFRSSASPMPPTETAIPMAQYLAVSHIQNFSCAQDYKLRVTQTARALSSIPKTVLDESQCR
ncbi:hypothetical protein B0H10DRAFT_378527 [Mycena sp. CBHHK59/15]|nr:hypothetical protein B0H10DRAFT_378527 [Mycena sp. CBHHK59/15]